MSTEAERWLPLLRDEVCAGHESRLASGTDTRTSTDAM